MLIQIETQNGIESNEINEYIHFFYVKTDHYLLTLLFVCIGGSHIELMHKIQLRCVAESGHIFIFFVSFFYSVKWFFPFARALFSLRFRFSWFCVELIVCIFAQIINNFSKTNECQMRKNWNLNSFYQFCYRVNWTIFEFWNWLFCKFSASSR